MSYLNDRVTEASNRLKEGWDEISEDVRDTVKQNADGLAGLAKNMTDASLKEVLKQGGDALNVVAKGMIQTGNYIRLDNALNSLKVAQFRDAINKLDDQNISQLFTSAMQTNCAAISKIYSNNITETISNWTQICSPSDLANQLATHTPNNKWLGLTIKACIARGNLPGIRTIFDGVLNARNEYGDSVSGVLTEAFVSFGKNDRNKILSQLDDSQLAKFLSHYQYLPEAGRTIIAETLSEMLQKAAVVSSVLTSILEQGIPAFQDVVARVQHFDRLGPAILQCPPKLHKELINFLSGNNLGKLISGVSAPYLHGIASALCVSNGSFDKECFKNKMESAWKPIAGTLGPVKAQFTTPGHVSVNLLTGAYDVDIKLGLGELFLTQKSNDLPSWDVTDWYEFCSSLREISYEVDDSEYYDRRSDVDESSYNYTYFSSKRWVNYFSVSELANAVAWAIITQGASVKATVERTAQMVYMELEDMAVWLTSFDRTAMIDRVIPMVISQLASGARGGQILAYSFAPSGVNYVHTPKKTLHNVLSGLLQSFSKDREFERWDIADRHLTFELVSGIPLPTNRQALHRKALKRIVDAYKGGTQGSEAVLGAFIRSNAEAQRTITQLISKRLETRMPSSFLTYEKFREQTETALKEHGIVSLDDFTVDELSAIQSGYDGQSPRIDLSQSGLATILADRLGALAMGNDGEARINRIELDVMTASLAMDVEIVHKHRFDL